MSDYNYFEATVQYKGTNYLGWQIQKNQGLTVQGEINNSLAKLTKSQDFKTLGAGRTDAGVHAFGQVVKITLPLQIDPKSLKKAINSLLPEDIRIVKLSKSSESFHPVFHAKWKEYLYFFTNERNDRLSPFIYDQVANHPFELDFDLMNRAVDFFIGKKDFCNFYCTGTDVSSTVRTIFEFELKSFDAQSKHFQSIPKHYVLRVKGDGFLKQMVRLMVGTLWNIGRKKVTLAQLENAFKVKLDYRLGMVAPPQGLYLNKVRY